jgi:hypothetical protein
MMKQHIEHDSFMHTQIASATKMKDETVIQQIPQIDPGIGSNPGKFKHAEKEALDHHLHTA